MSRQDVSHHYAEPEVAGSQAETQWDGTPAPKNEAPNSVIKVWQISPHINRSYDCCVIRDYHKAMKWAQDVVETVMDDDDWLPVAIEIKVVKMRLGEFRELHE